MNVVVLAGGSPHAHDFGAVGAALTEIIEGAGNTVHLADNPDHAAALVNDDTHRVAALVVDGLWWRMLGPAYDQWRDSHAYSPSDATRSQLASFVRSGGGLVALHTAVICFDDWPEWGAIVGGSWRWDTSWHPPYGPVRAQVVADHPILAGIGSSIELHDEVYGDLAIRDDVNVLATASRGPDDGEQPVLWTQHYGDGRVVFDCFGHDARSIRDQANARIVTQALSWVTEERTDTAMAARG